MNYPLRFIVDQKCPTRYESTVVVLGGPFWFFFFVISPRALIFGGEEKNEWGKGKKTKNKKGLEFNGVFSIKSFKKEK